MDFKRVSTIVLLAVLVTFALYVTHAAVQYESVDCPERSILFRKSFTSFETSIA